MSNSKNPSSDKQITLSSRKNFQCEIELLLDKVPAEQWDDPEVTGVLYDFLPWHRMSSVVIQTKEDDPRDIGDWKYYYSAESDGTLVMEQFEAWHQEEANKQLVYHQLLIEAAEALLSINFEKYNNPELPPQVRNLRFWHPIENTFCLNKHFLLQVYDHDLSYQFNYCEYVMARRLETDL